MNFAFMTNDKLFILKLNAPLHLLLYLVISLSAYHTCAWQLWSRVITPSLKIMPSWVQTDSSFGYSMWVAIPVFKTEVLSFCYLASFILTSIELSFTGHKNFLFSFLVSTSTQLNLRISKIWYENPYIWICIQ